MSEYTEGYVYELMDQGGPTDEREPYFLVMSYRNLAG